MKKLLLTAVALISNLHAMSFEDSPALKESTNHFKTTHEILSALPPVEILIPRGTFAFTGWYITTIEEYFHNVVTPILQLKIDYKVNITDDMESVKSLLTRLIDERNNLMIEGYKKAFDVAIKIKMDYAMNERMTDESTDIGCLMTLNHYRERQMSASYNNIDIPYAVAEAIDVLEGSHY
jgi:hypothetical protein